MKRLAALTLRTWVALFACITILWVSADSDFRFLPTAFVAAMTLALAAAVPPMTGFWLWAWAMSGGRVCPGRLAVAFGLSAGLFLGLAISCVLTLNAVVIEGKVAEGRDPFLMGLAPLGPAFFVVAYFAAALGLPLQLLALNCAIWGLWDWTRGTESLDQVDEQLRLG